MADSTGIISQLDRYRRPGQGRWVPILDGAAHKRETKGETYWPVGISESSLSCILLKVKLLCLEGYLSVMLYVI